MSTQIMDVDKDLSGKDKGHDNSKMNTYRVLSEFCEQTSMHGLGQVVRHTLFIAKAAWLVAFVCSVSSNGYHISMLAQNYLKHPVQETSSLSIKPVPFPSVTVCSTDPLSPTNFKKLRNDGNSNVSKYLHRINEMKQKTLKNNKRK